MLKTSILVFLIFFVTGCGTAPAPTRTDVQSFSVISEQTDRVASTLTLLIKVSGPATQQNVKSIVESVIANRKGDFRHILVKSITEGMTANDVPFAISRLENDVVTHRFNSTAETERIPTH